VSGDLGSTPVTCEFCKEQIRADAVVCKHCGRDVTPQLPRLEKEESERVRAAAELEQKAVADSERQRLEEQNQRELQQEIKQEKISTLKNKIKRNRVKIVSIGSLFVIAIGSLTAYFIYEDNRNKVNISNAEETYKLVKNLKFDNLSAGKYSSVLSDRLQEILSSSKWLDSAVQNAIDEKDFDFINKNKQEIEKLSRLQGLYEFGVDTCSSHKKYSTGSSWSAQSSREVNREEFCPLIETFNSALLQNDIDSAVNVSKELLAFKGIPIYLQ
jgi:hypothetical protein